MLLPSVSEKNFRGRDRDGMSVCFMESFALRAFLKKSQLLFRERNIFIYINILNYVYIKLCVYICICMYV